MRYFKKLILYAILSVAISGCAIYHHYGEYSGKIVDAETKQPLEGAVVLVKYYTWTWGSPGGQSSHYLDAQEAVADKKGEFKISSLNAFAFRPLATFEPEPGFTIFKPRYECYTRPMAADSRVTIELRQLKTVKERIANLSCTPVNVPNNRMMQFLKIQDIERIELGFKPGFLKEEPK